MPLRDDFLAMSQAARPRIIKLAERGKLVDECFKEFQRQVFPGAPQDQVAEMRVCFYAGAAELNAMLFYAMDPSHSDPTDQDMQLLDNINGELERFYERIKALAEAKGKATQ